MRFAMLGLTALLALPAGAQLPTMHALERSPASAWRPVIVDRVATVSIDPSQTQRLPGDEWAIVVEYRFWQDKPLTKTASYASEVLHQRVHCPSLASRDVHVQLYTRSGRPIKFTRPPAMATRMTTAPADTFQGALVRAFCSEARGE